MISSILYGIGINWFLIPANVYSSGFGGLSQLIATTVHQFYPALSISNMVGVLYLVFNIPVLVLAWHALGRKFVSYTILSVISCSVALHFIPNIDFSSNVLLNAIFGGIFCASGVALTLRSGASTGGLDVISLVMIRKTNFSFGRISLSFNVMITVIAGIAFGVEKSLYTLISLYTNAKVVDTIYTSKFKIQLTMVIDGDRLDTVRSLVLKHTKHGLTYTEARGGYTDNKKQIIYTVITRDELPQLAALIHQADSSSFITIQNVGEVKGKFLMQ
ncbi:YitT family protein [Sporolactobacillus nakayamae]|uniref:YitT family protein n=1 Tax=Sporolactobacillus nakayamae TaxID=269670 RepID=UPI002481CEA1|nr:YitT family protein [Sporolactobacillus nakayamae]